MRRNPSWLYGCFLAGFSLLSVGCGEEEDTSCRFPANSLGEDVIGSWSGKASLVVEGVEVSVPISAFLSASPDADGVCVVEMELVESMFKLCGYRFTGPLSWHPASGEWRGTLETSDGGPQNQSTTFVGGISPMIGDRLALRVEITQSTNSVCLDRTIEGNLPRAE